MIKTTLPFALAKALSQIGLNREIGLPANENARAGEIARLLLTIGEGDLPSKFRTSDFKMIIHVRLSRGIPAGPAKALGALLWHQETS